MTPEDYMRQACHTAHDYLLRATKDIDAIFGEDYSKKHPDAYAMLVGQYIRTAAQDFHTSILTQEALPSLCASLDGMAEALGSMTIAPDPNVDHPFHVQVWGTDGCGEQVTAVRVRKVEEQ